mmetsp:Transcript_67305/g.156255  ORF Transcript_67305/g.156255 Transcript_67305/m.156255 type:complete len:263 (+) Transcript_67305:133-921(+)
MCKYFPTNGKPGLTVSGGAAMQTKRIPEDAHQRKLPTSSRSSPRKLALQSAHDVDKLAITCPLLPEDKPMQLTLRRHLHTKTAEELLVACAIKLSTYKHARGRVGHLARTIPGVLWRFFARCTGSHQRIAHGGPVRVHHRVCAEGSPCLRLLHVASLLHKRVGGNVSRMLGRITHPWRNRFTEVVLDDGFGLVLEDVWSPSLAHIATFFQEETLLELRKREPAGRGVHRQEQARRCRCQVDAVQSGKGLRKLLQVQLVAHRC